MRNLVLPSVVLLASAVCSQSPPVGYRALTTPLPAGASCPLLLADASIVYFTGTELVRATGTSTKTLLRFATPVFGSFTRLMGDVGLLFGESANGELWLVDPDGLNAPRKLATLAFNYDAAYHRNGFAVVSAKVGGFSSPDNEVHSLDLRSGATDLLARLPGASGPVATMHEDGKLLYATSSNSFPPPPGSSDVVSYTEAQVLGAFGPTHLTLRDAALVFGGFDSAGALVSDDDRDVFVADWKNARVHEIDDLGAASRVFIEYGKSGLSPVSFQFVREFTRLAPVFEPFQNKFNRLLVFEADAALKYGMRDVAANRLVVKVSPPTPIPRGRFSVSIGEGPPKGYGVFFFGLPPRGGNTEDAYFQVPGFEFPFLWAIDFARPWVGMVVPLDAAGSGNVDLENTGAVARVDAQVFLLDARGIAVGTSAFAQLGFVVR